MAQMPIEHYNEINQLSEEDFLKKCRWYNDCSICRLALHKDLLSTTKHTCIYGMSLNRYLVEIEECGAYY